MKKYYWYDVKDNVKAVNIELFAIIDKINPKFEIIKSSYKYGEMIDDGEYYYLNHSDGSSTKISNLSFPYILPLNKTIETFTEHDGHIQTGAVYKKGELCPFIYNKYEREIRTTPIQNHSLSAGVRNVTCLSFNKESKAFISMLNTIKLDYKLKASDLSSHFEILRRMTSINNSQWRCNLLIFGKDWDHEIQHNEDWHSLKYYLMSKSLKFNEVFRSEPHLNGIINRSVHSNYIYNNSHVIDTIKEIILATAGGRYSYKVVSDESDMPLEECVEYVKRYYRCKFVPFFVTGSHNVLSDKCNKIYYPHEYNSQGFGERPKNSIPNQRIMEEVANVFPIILKELSNSKIFRGTFYATLENILNLACYTPRGARGQLMSPSANLLVNDGDFKVLYEKYKDKKHDLFPSYSYFSKCLYMMDLKA